MIQSKSNNRGWSPVIGVLLMVVVTFIFTMLAVFVVYAAGVSLTTLVDLKPFALPIVIFFILSHVASIGYGVYKLEEVTVEEVVKTDTETHSITDEEIEENEIAVVTFEVEKPDTVTLDEPLTVAPTNANPRNWKGPAQLHESSIVKFITETTNIPTEIDSDDELFVPEESYGSLNARYELNSVEAFTVYDSELNEVTTVSV